jgi:4-hydroxybenzoyl-CoA thioesterase
METFTLDITVRWMHCDPAGIIFTPRYFDMTHTVMEDWFDKALGVPFDRLHGPLGLGIPTVHLEADFVAASRLNDVHTFDLTLAKLGKASADLSIKARCGDEARMSARIVIAQVSLDPMRARPWLPEIRTEMERFVAT